MDSDNDERHRLDKWLWHVRFFKTRSLASQAIAGGKVKLDGERIKPARAVHAGQLVSLTLGERALEVEVLSLPVRRGSAPEAQACYAETPASAVRSATLREQQRLAAIARPRPDHRPDKRERRQLDHLRRRQS